tara:strand:+ start:1083 stop:1364 length:282 start_codon:yes stop_codon:yes gene_type:complete
LVANDEGVTNGGEEVMNRDAIERAERLARKLDDARLRVDAVQEAKGFKKPRSIRSTRIVKKRDKVRDYEFTDRQLQIAAGALDAEDSVRALRV